MRKNHNLRVILSPVLLSLAVLCIVICFFSAVSNLTAGHQSEDLKQLEETLRRAAVACYAAEGIYPPNLDYLVTRYGVQIDEKRYVVDYIPIAENLMPDITVLEK